MTKVLLLVLFLLSGVSVCIYAQGDFAPIGAVWHYDYLSYGKEHTGYTIQKSVKDTVVAGQPCRKIERTRYQKHSYMPNTRVDTITMSPVYIYSNPDTVFYFNGEFDRFLPLYIFNINKGDTLVYHVAYNTLPNTPLTDSFFRLVVTNVTDTVIGGKTLKTIHSRSLDDWGFDGADSRSYTEVFGCQQGLAVHKWGDHIATYFPAHIRCYNDTGINYQKDTTSCDYIEQGLNNIGGIAERNGKISVYPNPVSGVLHIALEDKNDNPEQIEMYDLTGKRILVVDTYNNDTGIDVCDIAKGMYLLRIKTGNGNSLSERITIR